jgi:hypothetical protein
VAAKGGEVDLDPFERIDSWTDLITVQGKGSLPFLLQGLIDGEKWPTVVASGLGMRTSEWVEYDGLRDNRGVKAKQLESFIAEENIRPEAVQNITMDFGALKGQTLEFNLSQEIANFGDLQPYEQELFRTRYPRTFEIEKELTRALAEERNAPDWAIKRVKAWDAEDEAVKTQEKSDALFQAEVPGGGREDWKADYEKNMYNLMLKRKEIYGYDEDEPTSALDVFYAKIDDLMEVNESSIMTDVLWQELAVWRENQPEWFQDYVDANTGLSAPTEETRRFELAKTVLANKYWGVVTNVLEFPEASSQRNTRIWVEPGEREKFFKITQDEAYIYNTAMAMTEGPRKDFITVLPGEKGTTMEKIKNGRKTTFNKVASQVNLLRKFIRTDDKEVGSYINRYYPSGLSAEARIQRALDEQLQDILNPQPGVGATP